MGRIFILTGILSVAMLLAADMVAAAAATGDSFNSQMWGRDFANLWSAGRLWIEDRTAILYDVEAYQAWQHIALDPAIDNHNYSYPPVSLFYAPLFGALPYVAALLIFLTGSAAAFWFAARPWLRQFGLSAWWALALPTSLLCLWAGHYGLLVGALWCACWSWLDRRPVRAGIATGLMLVKPHLAILMPLLLARRGAWRAIAAAAATVVVLIGGSALLFGTELWRVYLTSTSGTQLALVEDSETMFAIMMPTLAIHLVHYGLSLGAALAVQALVGASVIGMLVWRLPADPVRAGALGATATFLVLPYGFNYDMTVFGLAALLFLADASRRKNRIDSFVAGLALALPPGIIWLGAMHVRIAPLVVGALFVLMWRRWAWLPGRGLGSGEAVALGA